MDANGGGQARSQKQGQNGEIYTVDPRSASRGKFNDGQSSGCRYDLYDG